MEAALVEKNKILPRVYNTLPMEADEIIEEYAGYAERLRPMWPTPRYWSGRGSRPGNRCCFEGAQGTLLDIDHGTYPFVTSSNPTAGGASVGTGIGPKAIDKIIGVTKAYISRVGTGPFPTELQTRSGTRWSSSVASTGRSPVAGGRCGWLDLVALRYACRVNGFTRLFLTKMDILSAFDEIKVATAYTSAGGASRAFPRPTGVLYHCEPEYDELPGWREDITGVRYLRRPPQGGSGLHRVHPGGGLGCRSDGSRSGRSDPS